MSYRDMPIDMFCDQLKNMLHEGERRLDEMRDAADRLQAVAADVRVNIRSLEAAATEAMRAPDTPNTPNLSLIHI